MLFTELWKMPMVFNDHETRWREGADVRRRHELLKKNKARGERIATHANRERSFYFAPKGKLDEAEISTDDYYWHTRVHGREKQGQNILKFPKTFGDLHDGKRAGGKPKVERPFSGSVMSDDSIDAKIQLAMWGEESNLFSSAGAGVTFTADTEDFTRGDSRLSRSGGRSRGGMHTPTISEEAQDMAESFFNSKLGDGGKSERERLRVKRVQKSREGEWKRKSRTPLSPAGTTASAGSSAMKSRNRSRSPSRSRSGHHPGRGRSSSPPSRGAGGADPDTFHNTMAAGTEYMSTTPDAYMAGPLNLRPDNAPASKPFDPLDKEFHQDVLRYGGDGFFLHEPEPPSIHDPPHIIHPDRTVAGGLVHEDVLNDKYLQNVRVHEGKTRKSVGTMKERKMWIIDEAAETVSRKYQKMWNPPKRPYRADVEDNQTSTNGATHTDTDGIDADPHVHAHTHFSGLIQHLAKRDAVKATRRTPLREIEVALIQGVEGGPGSLIDRTKFLPTDAAQGVAIPPGLLLKLCDYQVRPKSAPAEGGRRKQHTNPFYYETLMMQSERPLSLPRLGVGAPETLMGTVSIYNLHRVAAPLHFGYDEGGNLTTIVAASNQAIVRPRSASRAPETQRELDATVINSINERRLNADGKKAIRQGMRALEKAAIAQGSKIVTRPGTTASGTWTAMWAGSRPSSPGGRGLGYSPASSPGLSPAGSQVLSRMNTPAAPPLLARNASSTGGGVLEYASSAGSGAGAPGTPKGKIGTEMSALFADSAAAGGVENGENDDEGEEGRSRVPDDDSTVEMPEEYYKAMHRTRVRVPKFIVPTPLLDVPRKADIVLYNEKDKAPISGYRARKERQALMGVYHATRGEGWKKQQNWGTDEPTGSWQGVTVDSRGYVIELRLNDNNMEGVFPVDLGRLTELEVLNMDKNSLRGPLSESALNHLEQLEVLSVRKNRFTGDIPYRVLSLLTKLRELWLSENEFTGEMDLNLGNISQLSHFDVYHNHITGTIPEAIGYLERLEVFSAGHNQLRGKIPDEMQACHRLTYLSLYDNKLEGELPNWLMELQGLLELNLNFNRFRGYVPKSAKEMFEKKSKKLARAARTAERHMQESRAASRRQKEEDAKKKALSRYSSFRGSPGGHASLGSPGGHNAAADWGSPGTWAPDSPMVVQPWTPGTPEPPKPVVTDSHDLVLARDFVNTAGSTDEGYEYIRTVSRIEKERGKDGLGGGMLVPEDKGEEFERLERWRLGSRQRKMSVYMGGSVEKREMTVSTLPPPDREDAGATAPHLVNKLTKPHTPKSSTATRPGTGTDSTAGAAAAALPADALDTAMSAASATGGAATEGSKPGSAKGGGGGLDDTGGTMTVERVLGATVLMKKIAMNDQEKMAEAGMDTTGAKIELEARPDTPPYQLPRYPTGTPRGLLDDRLKDPKQREITTDHGLTLTPEHSIADLLDDTSVGSQQSEDTLDTLLLLKANLKQNTDVVDMNYNF